MVNVGEVVRCGDVKEMEVWEEKKPSIGRVVSGEE